MKKKTLSLALALVMCLGLCAFPASAMGGDCIMESGVLTGYDGPGGDVVIPDGVLSIGDGAFMNCTDLTSVTIPDGVTSIGESAFADCGSLTSVVIPGSVTSIGDGAFMYCTGLTSVTIPDGVTSIGESAFEGCGSLTSVVIPDSVASIGARAFEGCKSLTSVAIPSGVTSISGGTFEDCENLINVTIPESITFVAYGAFDGTPWKKNQGEFVIINGLLVCYQGSGGAVTVPADVTRIGSLAFDGENLTSVTIPSSVTWIGSEAFYECTGLISVTIPDSATRIGGGAFADCKSLTDIYYDGSKAEWETIQGDFRSDLTNVKIHYADGAPQEPPAVTVEAIPSSGTAYASTQTVNVDGRPVQFQMYALKDANGNGTNYIKLRDLAYVLNGTKAQFQVGYDGTVSLTTGQGYTAAGTEMSTPFTGDRSYPTGGALPVKVDGQTVDMTAFTLVDDAGGGYNYFKLRDLGQVLGFNVYWADGQGVSIQTDRPYTG